MKKILITQRLVKNDSYPEQREMLDIRWGELFEELNFLPIVLPVEYSLFKYFEELEIEGVFIAGGNDLNGYNPNELSKKRDLFEKELISFAIKKDIPIFAVCRGLQIVAEYFGCSFKKVYGQTGIKHKLKVNINSKYYKQLSLIKQVNAFHTYAIKDINEDLIVSATNEDGMIKCIEHRTLKIFAQMWHSEREIPFNNEELNLIRDFFSQKFLKAKND